MKKKGKILVTGAGGFVGKNVVQHLLIQGWKVKAMVRRPVLFPFSRQDSLEIVYADMRDPLTLQMALKGVSAVVHLAAAKADERNSMEVNVQGARNLIEACKIAGCKRIINMSTQSVKIKQKGLYAHSKSKADNIFHGSGFNVTTLRPSVIYGEEPAGVFGSIIKYVQKLPIIPILGSGEWISAPIYIGDVSKAIISCIKNDKTTGQIYDLGGPDLISFNDFIDTVCEKLDVKRPKIHIPFQISMILAHIVSKLFLKPPLTVSNVLGSNQDTHIDITKAYKEFGFSPVDLHAGLKTILDNRVIPSSKRGIVFNGSKDESLNEIDLMKESFYITRYLLGCDPPKELSDRYVQANRILFRSHNINQLDPEIKFIRKYPFMISFIDAAVGLFHPESNLRKKIYLMAAILEATPVYADFFLYQPKSFLRSILGIFWQGLRSVVKLVIGIPVMMLIRRG